MASLSGEPLQEGESIAVSGPCLTVEKVFTDGFSVFASSETVKRTTVADLTRSSVVNLERAMPASGRFGGHFVSGHVDGVGRLLEKRDSGEAVEMKFEAPADVSELLVAKGSIAVDGVSLALNKVEKGYFTIMVIPHTLSETTISSLRRGTAVNLEADMLARYVRVFAVRPTEGISEKMLRDMGW